MTLSEVGNAAGGTAHDAGVPRQREPFAPRPLDADDRLLDAIRRTLVPVDPVAGLLAQWLAAPPGGRSRTGG